MESKNIMSCSADTAATKYAGHQCQLCLLQMPHEILERILTYLTFDEISLCRQVLNTCVYKILGRFWFTGLNVPGTSTSMISILGFCLRLEPN